MYIDNKILVGKNKKTESILLLDKANRHGLITGASGTGKTITSKVMAESFSDAGVPVQIISSDGVVKLLKSLTPEQISRYKTRALELNNALYLGYQAYRRRVNENIRIQKENEDFIDGFGRRYKK